MVPVGMASEMDALAVCPAHSAATLGKVSQAGPKPPLQIRRQVEVPRGLERLRPSAPCVAHAVVLAASGMSCIPYTESAPQPAVVGLLIVAYVFGIVAMCAVSVLGALRPAFRLRTSPVLITTLHILLVLLEAERRSGHETTVGAWEWERVRMPVTVAD